MRWLVNALSVTNASGRYVVGGHLARLAGTSAGRHTFDVLFHPGNADLCRDLGPNVRWRRCPALCRHWVGRTLWEHARLEGLCRSMAAEAAFTPAGVAMPLRDLPQLVFCQNPWALVPGVPRTPGERFKAALQRRAYRTAVRRAHTMAFLSSYLADAYARHAGSAPRRGRVAYCGIHDDTFAAAANAVGVRRVAGQIVCVSAMARHKDVATLLQAVAELRTLYGRPLTLKLVGPWPDAAYRREMEALAKRLSLDRVVQWMGHVTQAELYRLCAESAVFALFSRCESFGIPAVEAQAFGTPVVAARCCAVPEVTGEGALLVPPGDAREGAAALNRVLSDDAFHRMLSAKARANANRFRWDDCGRPLQSAVDGFARAGGRG